MGLLDAAISAVSAKLSNQLGGAGGNAVESVLAMLGNSQNGGIESLMQNFKDKGLGDIIASWVGTGSNLPISPDQVACALGHDQVRQYAQQTGATPDAAAASLAQLLPGLIDKLTPNGTLPAGGFLEQGLNLLKAQIGGHA